MTRRSLIVAARTAANTAALARPGITPPSDPLAALDDLFDGGAADIESRGWTWYKESCVATQAIADGRLRVGITAGGFASGANISFWYNEFDGCLLHKTVSGDCEMRARTTVWNTAYNGLPTATQFRVAGIAIHDPDRSTAFNYTHIGGGVINGTRGVETKNTVANASTFPAATLSPTSPWLLDVMIRRVGTSITTHYRHAPSVELLSDDGWTQHQSYTRAFPTACQWGLMCYSNTTIHDIGIDYHEVRFRTPS